MLHDLVVTPGMPFLPRHRGIAPARAGAGAMQGSVDVLENGLPMFLTHWPRGSAQTSV